MNLDRTSALARERGNLPNRYYYQLNGKSPQENYIEQKKEMIEKLLSDEEDDTVIAVRTVVEKE